MQDDERGIMEQNCGNAKLLLTLKQRGDRDVENSAKDLAIEG